MGHPRTALKWCCRSSPPRPKKNSRSGKVQTRRAARKVRVKQAKQPSSRLVGYGLLFASLPEQLHNVTVQGALRMVQGSLPILILGVYRRARCDQVLDALELLMHGRPHEGRLPSLGVSLQGALLLDKGLQKHVVTGLHRTEERGLAVGVLVVNLRLARDQ